MNGFYNQINNNVYIRDLGIFDYNYKSDVIQDMLKNSFLINLYNYSNNFNSLWYNDYYYKNQNNYSGYFLDPTLNYNIASILNKYDINDTNNIYSNFANLIKTEYNNGNYLQFGNGIIFNKIYEPTFNNQISTINLLIKYYKNNYDYQVKKIISLLINQLSNQNWLLDSKDNIHAYINSNNEYVGTIFENILPNLSELKTNLKAININTDFVDRYIEIFKTSIEKNVETN